MLHEIKHKDFLATVEPMGAFVRLIVYNGQGNGISSMMVPKEVSEQLSKAFNDCI